MYFLLNSILENIFYSLFEMFNKTIETLFPNISAISTAYS